MKLLIKTITITALIMAYSYVVDIPASILASDDYVVINSKALVLIGGFIIAQILSDVKSSIGRLIEAGIVIFMVVMLSDVVAILQSLLFY